MTPWNQNLLLRIMLLLTNLSLRNTGHQIKWNSRLAASVFVGTIRNEARIRHQGQEETTPQWRKRYVFTMEHLDTLPEIVLITHMFPIMHKAGRTRQEGDTPKETPQGHVQTMLIGTRRRPRINLPRPRIKIPRARRECRPRSPIQEMPQQNQDRLGQSHLGSRLQVPNQVLRHPSDRTRNGLNPNIDGYQRWKLQNLLMLLTFLHLLFVISRTCHGREYRARMTKVDPVSKWTGFQRPINSALCRSSYGGISSDFGLLVVAVPGTW